MSKVVGVLIEGKPTFHASPTGVADYDTLCCLDANDDVIGHGGLVDAPRGQKITCTTCHSIWKETIALRLRESDFRVED